MFIAMFSIFLGWPKASKCKKMIKRARCRLRQLQNKRQVIATQVRKDMAQLMQNGYEETAIKRLEKQLIQDESLVAAYELLDHFFVFILEKLSYIRRHKNCPPDISEAVSSLIFASARCGDFPELRVIRKLFQQRYGEDFATAAVELFPGNLVNKELIENLSVMSMPDDQKHIEVDEIARDKCLHPEVKEHEGNQLVESDAQINHTITESKINPSEVEEIERDATCLSSSISKPSDTFSLPESTLTETSALVSSVQQYPPYLTYHPLQKEVEKEDFADLQNKGEIMALVPSERVSLVPYAEAMVEYYVDEIEESESFVSKDSYCQDERLSLSCDDSDIDQEESRSERSSIRSFRKSKGAPKKRLRRRSSLLESQGIIEIGCIIYYQKPCKSHSTQKHGTNYNKMGKKPLVEKIPQSNYPHKENGTRSCQSQGNTKRKTLNLDLCDCNLDQPCYCGVYYDYECCEDLSIETMKGVKATQNQQVVLLGEFCHCLPLSQDESNNGVELVNILHKLNRETCSGAERYHLLTYPDCHLSKPNNETKVDTCKSLGSYSSTNVSNPRTSSSLTTTETAPPNSGALTMTPECPKNYKDKLLRTYSCTSQQQPKHVHPKLPEYEDIVAIFTAFKRERERVRG